jgi:hypothetical protein
VLLLSLISIPLLLPLLLVLLSHQQAPSTATAATAATAAAAATALERVASCNSVRLLYSPHCHQAELGAPPLLLQLP